MIKRNFRKKFFIGVILIVMFLVSNTFASGGTAIVTVSNENVAPNENFYLILNLSVIKYNRFQVDITNNQNLTTTETTGSVQGFSSNNVVTTLTIDKSLISLEKLGVVFTAPATEGIVNFNVRITSLDNSEQTITSQISNLNAEINTLQTTYNNLIASINSETDTTSQTYLDAVATSEELNNTINSKIAEVNELVASLQNYERPTITATTGVMISQNAGKAQNMNFDQNMVKDENMVDMESMKDKMKDMESMKDKMKDMENMSDEMKSKMGSLETSLKAATDTISSLSKNTTYQGSPNNYLSVLSVKGYDFTYDFDKTTNDYFITVDSNVSSLNVTATPEDSTATVTVYGNTDLESGQNKIIVNVTAEDSSVRTYRIYVTKQ